MGAKIPLLVMDYLVNSVLYYKSKERKGIEMVFTTWLEDGNGSEEFRGMEYPKQETAKNTYEKGKELAQKRDFLRLELARLKSNVQKVENQIDYCTNEIG
jgi:hypothetical protein